jgi:hypothetical protein
MKIIRTGLAKVAEALKQVVDQLEEVEKGPLSRVQQQFGRVSAPSAPEVQLTEDFLSKLPWKPYKGAVGDWIFSNLNSAQQLLKAIREAPEKQLIIGKYRYQIQRNGKFIGRAPA